MKSRTQKRNMCKSSSMESIVFIWCFCPKKKFVSIKSLWQRLNSFTTNLRLSILKGNITSRYFTLFFTNNPFLKNYVDACTFKWLILNGTLKSSINWVFLASNIFLKIKTKYLINQITITWTVYLKNCLFLNIRLEYAFRISKPLIPPPFIL